MDKPFFHPQRIKNEDVSWNNAREILAIKINVTISTEHAMTSLSDCTLSISPFADDLPEMEIRQYAPVNTKNGKGKLIFHINESSVGAQNMRELRGNSAGWNLLDCNLNLKCKTFQGYSETWKYVRLLDNDGVLEWELVEQDGVPVG